jgi:sirohydrochlorin ferrochelatase
VTRLVTVAHGTRNPHGNEVAADLTIAAGRLLGLRAVASYVELCEPGLAEALAASAEPTVVVPLLLSTGHHITHDLPQMLMASRGPVELGPPLGPHPRLAAAQVHRLREAGARPGNPVVMVAAGSRDPAAHSDLDRAASELAEAWGGEVRLATLSGPGARPEDVVTEQDAVSPYLLAHGHFATRARSASGGAAHVADVIGPHPLVARLVADRALALIEGLADRLADRSA